LGTPFVSKVSSAPPFHLHVSFAGRYKKMEFEALARVVPCPASGIYK